MSDINQEYVRECFDYDPESGSFVWKVRPRRHFETLRACSIWNSRFPGTEAGHVTSSGYRRVTFNKIGGKKKSFLIHRIIWLYVTGSWPEEEIDHVDHNRLNNKIANLREATKQENGKNQKLKSNNKSGVAGVCWSRRDKRWVAQVQSRSGRRLWRLFDSFDDAVSVVVDYRKLTGFHENHGE